ncbi:MAG: glutamate racemase [Lachnospiraceae bacterium]|nr:glutamate racemase [Lachnospiraceae bacterium]
MGREIAVFDSGVGGISVLRELVRQMPGEDFYFYGDSAHAPYGTKSTQEVRDLTIAHTKDFIARGCKGVVIACNTATSAAVRVLRQMYPDLPIVGIEPALKPAVENCPGGRILVLATPMTIREEKFHRLLAKYEDRAFVIPLPAPGLMEFVERGDIHSADLKDFLEKLLDPYRIGKPDAVDGVVLGCTHYPFVADTIAEVLGDGVRIFDGAEGTAREMRRRLDVAGRLEVDEKRTGRVIFANSQKDPEKIELMEKLLGHGNFA